MVSVKIGLKDDFKERFGIEEIVKTFTWWQKSVFIIKINQEVQVLKVFKNYWKRDIRELEIYEDYKSNKYLPKIIKVEEYKGDTIVFEKLIDWETLEECKEKFRWNYELASTLIRDIVNVLDEMWKQWIIHRDIKPNNIIIKDWKPYIIDFWIAKQQDLTSLTETWFQPWTLRFASPEQILWKKELVDYSSDIFSIGVLIYYLYFWYTPFGNNINEIKEMFENWRCEYELDKNCWLCEFFTSVFNIKPQMRPRKKEKIFSLLK
jgi:serine/threonine-protein kinase